LHSKKVRVIGGSIQKTRNAKAHSQVAHATARVHFVPMHGTGENLSEGTQLEVAHGKKFCKAGCQIKNADLVTPDRPGAGKRAGWGFSFNEQFCVLQRRSLLWRRVGGAGR
jgi:hypothetical protein